MYRKITRLKLTENAEPLFQPKKNYIFKNILFRLTKTFQLNFFYFFI